MKLSDKALRQIGRKLLDRTDSNPLQDDTPLPGKPAVAARAMSLRGLGRKRKAAVLTFKKRPR